MKNSLRRRIFSSAKRNISHISETCSGRTLQKVPGGSEKKSEQPGRSSHCRVDRMHTIERTDSCLLMVDWPKYVSSWKDFKWNCCLFFRIGVDEFESKLWGEVREFGEGKTILARVSTRLELALVRVIEIRLYSTKGKIKYTKLGRLTWT